MLRLHATLPLLALSVAAPAQVTTNCAKAVFDVATGNCVMTDSTGVVGQLYPLSNDFCVTPSGHVGMGTTNPQQHLQLGEFFTNPNDTYIEMRTIGGPGSQLRQGIKFRSSNPFFGFDIEHDDGLFGLNISRFDADFGAASGTSALFIDRHHGYVGIGNTDPIAELEIIGNDGNNADLRLQRAGESHGYNLAAGFDHFFLTRNDGTTFENHIIVNGPTGNVAIGDFAPTQKLDVDGNVRCVSLIQTSDERLKEDVRELEGALDTVRALRGVSYEWDTELMPSAGEGRRVGFLAQEVREQVPEAVHENSDGYLAVAYAELVPVLVEAVKELDQENAELTRRVNELESMAAQIEELKAALAELGR